MRGAYVIGEPGSGKSSLMRSCLGDRPDLLRERPVPHGLYLGTGGAIAGAQIGLPHRSFPGTDRLSMSIQPAAIDWVRGAPVPALVGEGDRLATVAYLDAMIEVCDVFTLLWLDTPAEVAEDRRRARGSNQSPTWIRGRRTKVDRLVGAYPDVVRLDGATPLRALAELAIEAAPALRALAGTRDPSPI